MSFKLTTFYGLATTPKGKAPNKTIPRNVTFSVSANAVAALQDLSAVLIEILDDRTTK
jgi:hypothetical protein